MTAQAASGSVLSSDWTGLSPHLIASFYPVERRTSADNKSSYFTRVPGTFEVRAPISDGQMEATMNWHSPFENNGADQQFSAISAMFQSGAAASLMLLVKDFVDKAGIATLSAAAQRAVDTAKGLEGRTSMTKLSSTQTFNGMAPAKLTLTAHFRALRNPSTEVEEPLNQLMRWALPQELAQDGPIVELLRAGDPSMYPSRTPRWIGMSYANMQMLPLVIESVPYPLTGPRDKNGRMLSAQVALQLSTLAAIDANDWNSFQRGA